MRRKATAGNAALAKKAAIQPFYSLPTRMLGMQMARRPSWLHRWQRWHRLRHLGYLRSSASLPTRLVGLWRQSIPWFICAATKGYDNYICDFQGKMGHPPLPRRPDAVGGGRAVAR